MEGISELDGQEITRAERLLAKQNFDKKIEIIGQSQIEYFKKRSLERQEESQEFENDPEKFWNLPSKNTPEERTRIAIMAAKSRGVDKPEPKTTIKPRLFNKDGKPLNTNQAKIPFRVYEENGFKILDVSVYK